MSPIERTNTGPRPGFADNEEELGTDPTIKKPVLTEPVVEPQPFETTKLNKEVDALVAGIYDGHLRMQGIFSAEYNEWLRAHLGVPKGGNDYDYQLYTIGCRQDNRFGGHDMNTALEKVKPNRGYSRRNTLSFALAQDEKNSDICYLTIEHDALSGDASDAKFELKAIISRDIGQRIAALLDIAEDRYPNKSGDSTQGMASSIIQNIFNRMKTSASIRSEAELQRESDQTGRHPTPDVRLKYLEQIIYGHNVEPSADISAQQNRVFDDFDRWRSTYE